MVAAVELADEVLAAVGRVRVAWPYLAAILLPGTRPRTVERPVDPRHAMDRIRNHHADRQAAFTAAQAGRVVSGAHAAPVDLGVTQARADIAAQLVAAVEHAHLAVTGEPAGREVLMPVRPGTVRLPAVCQTCAGTGYTQPPRWWPDDRTWPPPPPRPHGLDPAEPWPPPYEAPPCRVCTRGAVWTTHTVEHDDAATVAALDVLDFLAEHLDQVTVDETVRTLTRAERRILTITGQHRDTRVIKAACPGCGRRPLHAEVASPNRSEWSVRCAHDDCVCGEDCPCRVPVRPGRRHVWPARRWDGDRGLARRLGVPLPEARGWR